MAHVIDSLSNLFSALASLLTAAGTLLGGMGAVGAMIALKRTGTVRPGAGRGRHRRPRGRSQKQEIPDD